MPYNEEEKESRTKEEKRDENTNKHIIVTDEIEKKEKTITKENDNIPSSFVCRL